MELTDYRCDVVLAIFVEIRCTEEIEAIKKTCSAAIDVKISGNPCTES